MARRRNAMEIVPEAATAPRGGAPARRGTSAVKPSRRIGARGASHLPSRAPGVAEAAMASVLPSVVVLALCAILAPLVSGECAPARVSRLFSLRCLRCFGSRTANRAQARPVRGDVSDGSRATEGRVSCQKVAVPLSHVSLSWPNNGTSTEGGLFVDLFYGLKVNIVWFVLFFLFFVFGEKQTPKNTLGTFHV